MASTGVSQVSVVVPLELAIDCEDRKTLKDGLEDVAKDLSENLKFLKKYIREKKELDCVSLTEVYFKKGKIWVCFELTSESQLDSLYECLTNKDKSLSKCLSDYCYDKSVEIVAGLPINARLKCSICMSRRIFLQCAATLCPEEASSDNEEQSSTSTLQTSSQHPLNDERNLKKKLAEIKESSKKSLSQPGSYPQSQTTHSDHDLDETKEEKSLGATEQKKANPSDSSPHDRGYDHTGNQRSSRVSHGNQQVVASGYDQAGNQRSSRDSHGNQQVAASEYGHAENQRSSRDSHGNQHKTASGYDHAENQHSSSDSHGNQHSSQPSGNQTFKVTSRTNLGSQPSNPNRSNPYSNQKSRTYGSDQVLENSPPPAQVQQINSQTMSRIKAFAFVTKAASGGTRVLWTHSSLNAVFQIQTVRKSFMLFYPDKTETMPMYIYSSTNKNLNGEMKYRGHLNYGSMYEYCVDLPLDTLFGVKYCYRCDPSQSSRVQKLWNWVTNETFHTSREYFLKGSAVHRDVWTSSSEKIKNIYKFDEKWVTAHMLDIIFHCANLHSASESCMQIETLVTYQLPQHYALNVIKNLAAILKDSNHCISFVLFTICIGNLLSSPSCLLSEKIIDPKVAAFVIEKVLQSSLTLCDLPESCKNYIHSTCYAMYKIGYGPSSPEICVLNTFYAFYGDNFMRHLIHDGKVCQSIDSSKASLKALHDLCTQLYENASRENSNAQEMIEFIMRHVPMKVALSIYAEMHKPDIECRSCEKDLQVILYGSINVQIESVLRTLKKQRISVFENLVNYLAVVSEHAKVWNTFKSKFEDTFISIIETCTTDRHIGNSEIAVTLLTEYGLFSTKEDKFRLLKLFMSSQNLCILKQVLKLSELQEMNDIFSTLDVEDFRLFCERYLYAQGWNSDGIKPLVTSLSHLWNIPFVSNRKVMHSILVDITIAKFRKQRISNLLNSIDIIEVVSKSTTEVAGVFLKHVRTYLEEKSESPESLLKMLKSRNDGPHLKTKLSADVVNITLDILGEFQADSGILERFESMVDNFQYWITVFNCTGEFKDLVVKHHNYRNAQKCIELVLDLFKKQEIQYDFITKMEKMTRRTSAAKRLLSHQVHLNEVEKMWIESGSMLRKVLKNIECVERLIVDLKSHEPRLGKAFTRSLEVVRKLENKLKSGKISASECGNDYIIWKDIGDLPVLSKELSNYIQSAVFWNTCMDIVYEEYTLLYDDPLLSVQRLFENRSSEEEYFGHGNPCELYASVLLKTGCRIYRDMWTELNSNDLFGMNQIHLMFGSNPDVEKEIKQAGEIFNLFIETSTAETLKRIYSIGSIAEAVEAVEKLFTVFEFDQTEDETYNTAITAFHNLLAGTAENSTFKEVKLALETVFVLVKVLSDNTISVMISLKTASTLVLFLKAIVDEDIKNLIDAVEDISEQQVQESTVSALIEVKQFLYPLLLFKSSGKCTDILKILERQTVSFGPNSKFLPQKIEDCVQNVHNLRSLYNGLANRSEQTKELVCTILEKGTYCFHLSEQFNRVEFDVVYVQNENNEIRKQSTLIDLRSRALLLMNTYRPESGGDMISGIELTSFIRDIDICIDIAETLFALHIAGHITYMEIKDNVISKELQDQSDYLKCTLNEWQDNLAKERVTHYLMNFIHGNQIHILHRYLENQADNLQAVKAILTFIHPDINVLTVKSNYEMEKLSKPEFDHRCLLHCIGHALHSSFEGMNVRHRVINDNRSKLLTSLVQPGKLMVAHLDEGSLHTVKTLLSLYINTTQCLPEPSHILFCTRETSWIELELLIQRCIGAYDFYGVRTLFCIAHVEILPGELQFRLVETLRNLERGAQYLLAVICRGSRNHPFVDELSECVSAVKPVTDRTVQDIFLTHCSNVQTLTSDLAGQGKSCYIKTVAHQHHKSVVRLHVSGQLRKMVLVDRISTLDVKKYHVLHIDIGNVDEPSELDTFLFELVVLKYVSAGRTAVKLESQTVYIELANTINDTLRNSLHTTVLFQRLNLNWNGLEHFLISSEIHSPVQIVCHYLKHLENGTLDNVDLAIGHGIHKPMSAGHCKVLLSKYIFKEESDAFPVMHTVINVLADQLKKMSHSSFFKVSRLREMVGSKTPISVKSKLVEAMIEVAVDFATRSVNNCRETQATTVNPMIDDGILGRPSRDIATTITSRTDGMIRWEDSNHLMFVFHNQNINTLSAFYRHLTKVPVDIRNLFDSQMKKKMVDFSTLEQKHFQDYLQKIARLNPLPLKPAHLIELSLNYALTADNLLKMVLIMLRIKANIPVLVMGETGCGKTSLIRYLASVCEVEFEVLNIHAGIPEDEIVNCVIRNNNMANEHLDQERWLFLDEINTSDSIGLMSDVICHHSCLGHVLSPNLIVMGACNPYKLRTNKDISTAGLEGKVKTDELSKLVYRVLPLPEIMVDYVWDFGSLNEKDEEMYIHRMIHDVFPHNEEFHILFTGLLSVSQAFVRKQEESRYSVSLRDVQRCKLLSKWFLDVFLKKTNKVSCKPTGIDIQIKAMILSLAHCYQSRFSKKQIRKEYRTRIGDLFLSHNIKFSDAGQESFINTVIKEEQADILRRMKLPPGIACNTALQENVFVILVCIFNKIPIFVVGKPGCSKSLAMQLIKSNLRGKDSEDDFFKKLPQLYCVSFQGSESSTSDGIVKVFKKAENYQDSNSGDEVLSVVVLDEIGLAEVSRFNPLKVLHSLLEPEGQSQPNVAVVGISNWALDASKMNRAIHLSRPDMDEEELSETASSISESFLNRGEKSKSLFRESYANRVRTCENIMPYLKGMASAYCQYIVQLRFKNFHGLRDYYSLVKYVSRVYAECDDDLSENKMAEVIMNGITRNFGGLPEEIHTLYDVFTSHISSLHVKHRPLLEIVGENITDPIARHLMLITTGESVLGILEQKLKTMKTKQKEIIFGSQFEEDLTDDYNYRILSKIILCMEQGMILVLKDLDGIYGSLYDMLNQNYTVLGKKKNCRVALGPYSNPMCHVADNFRCIVLVDEGKIDLTDPPFLNRFEKQYLRFSDIIQDKHAHLIGELECWLHCFSQTKSKFAKGKYLFPIHSKDLIASLVLKIESDSEKMWEDPAPEDNLLEECKQKLLMIMKPEAVVRQQNNQETILDFESLRRQYFLLPIHDGLEFFFVNQLKNISEEVLNEGILTVIFTNSNVHTKIKCADPNIRIQVEKLGSFKSEKQLTSRVQMFWKDENSNQLIVKCNAKEEEHHILLTKLIVERCRNDYKTQNYKRFREPKHVCIIIHLDRSNVSNESLSQLNFLSDWSLVMLDSIETPRIPLPQLYRMTLFEAIQERRPLNNAIKEELLWAFSRIRYETHGRDVESISKAICKIGESPEMLDILENEIFDWIHRQYDGLPDRYWPCEVACNVTALQSSSGFVNALEQYIMDKIKTPLAKLIYQIELTGMLESFFIWDTDSIPERDEVIEEKRKIWVSCLRSKCSVELSDIINASGPECYTCSTNDCLLRMPCSKKIYEAIETTRPDFMDMLCEYRLHCLLDDDEELPVEVFDEVLTQQECFILEKVPDLNEYTYRTWNVDYFEDFCSMAIELVLTGVDRLKRKPFLKHILNRQCVEYTGDSFAYVIRLHTKVWAHYDSICAELLLIDNCLNTMNECESALLEILSPADEMIGEMMTNHEFSQSEDEEITCNKNVIDPTILNQFIPDSATDKSASSDVGSFELCDFYDIFEEENERSSQIVNTSLISSGTDSDRDSSMQDDMCMNLNDRLVNCVCKLLLPTNKCIHLNGGISNWLLVADTTVSLAARVSRNPELLYSLKTCSELAQELIIPFQLHRHGLLEHIGEILFHMSLDSEVVFNAVMQIIDIIVNKKSPPCNEDFLICFQTLSSYFVRCASAYPSTIILSKLFDLVVDQKIPAQCIPLFKVPLDLLLQAVDENVFGNLLSNPDYLSFKDANACKDIISESDKVVLKAVDDMIICLFNRDCIDSPILVMIEDILETVFTGMYFVDLGRETALELFYVCHKLLNRHNPGLQYLASVAFCKCFIHDAVETIVIGTDDEMIRGMNTLNIVFTDLLKQGIHSLIVFLFKVLSNSKTLSQLEHFRIEFAEQFNFLQHLQFDSSVQNLHNSSLCMHVKEEVHQQLCFCCQDISSSYNDSISLLVEKANEDAHGLLQLFAFGMREFYLRQCDTDLDDTNRTQADILINKVLSSRSSDEIVAYIKCVFGRDNFKLNDFILDTSSSQRSICVFSFIVSLIGLTLAHNTFSNEDEEKSILAKALLDPESLNACVVPGFLRHLKSWSDTQVRYMGICVCRSKIVVRSNIDSSNCVQCGAKLNLSLERVVENYVHPELEQSVDPEGFRPLSKSSMYTCNPVTYHVLQLLMKACMLGSVALGFNDSAVVNVVSSSSISEASDMLLKDIFEHWDNIGKLVNVHQNETNFLLRSLLLEAESLLFKSCCPCYSIEESNDFEERLDKIVMAIFGKKTNSLQNLHQRHTLIHRQTASGRDFENQLFEVEDLSSLSKEEYTVQVPPLYRLTTTPTKTNFVFELCKRKHQFILLETVLPQENQLVLPCHIMSILQWHLATVANASYMIRKHDCVRMSAQEFVYFKSDTMKKDVIKRRFDEFRKSWEILKEALKGTKVGKDMRRIHIETKMEHCLLLDEKSVVLRVLHVLIDIQNRFLDSVAQIAYSNKSLQALTKKDVVVVPCVPLTELKTEDLLDVKLDWDSLLMRESHCELTYGHGTQVQYDFYRIEEYTAKEVVSGKKYITFGNKLPKIVFIDELHLNYASLLKEIRENVEQKELSADIRSGIITRKQDDPRMPSELLNHLGVVMTVVKRTKTDPEQPLVEFVDAWKSMMCRQFPKTLLPSPESSVKLCHVIALSELLEELCAETVRDGLADKYRDELDMPLRDHLVIVLKDEDLSSTLFKSLKRFIYRCLGSNTADPNQSIRHYLADDSFWPLGALQDNKVHSMNAKYLIEDLLPDGMMVRHVSECIDIIEREIEQRKKESLKLSGFASSFQRSKINPQVQRSVQRKKTAQNARRF